MSQDQTPADAAPYVQLFQKAHQKIVMLERLDEQMAKLGARKTEVDAKLADPAIYDDANKEQLKALIVDQAYLTKELEQLEKCSTLRRAKPFIQKILTNIHYQDLIVS